MYLANFQQLASLNAWYLVGNQPDQFFLDYPALIFMANVLAFRESRERTRIDLVNRSVNLPFISNGTVIYTRPGTGSILLIRVLVLDSFRRRARSERSPPLGTEQG